MAVRFPHVLYQKATSNSVKNSGGQYLAGNSEWVKVGRCRLEPAVQQRSTVVDQKSFSVSATIFLPTGTKRFISGDVIQVRDREGNVQLTNTVNRFDSGQLNSRIWV